MFEVNFREKFEVLNCIMLMDGEFQRFFDEIVILDVYEVVCLFWNCEVFVCDDGILFNYIFVNIKDWCKNVFEVVNQFCINMDNSYYCYDVMFLINGVFVVQIELKIFGISL